MIYLLALISIALGSTGQFVLKLAAGELRPDSGIWNLIYSMISLKMVFAVSCFVFSMLMWIFVLRKLELSIAYPMVSLGYILVMLLSFFFLQEQVSAAKVGGTLLIVAGVIVLNMK
ncbi:MAG: EamA family transporter [Candidatus Dehalobacter alkaniphilus]